jgi:GT2 family glycosyltransferase
MVAFRPPEEPTVSIIVVGLREAPALLRCLHSVAAHVLGISYAVHVVLCDPSEKLLRDLKREVTGASISVFRANLGFAQAVNFAAAQAKGDFLVLLNDDCMVTGGWLDALLATAAAYPQCGLVSSTYLHPNGTLQEAGSVLWSDGTTCGVGDGLQPGYMGFERRVTYGSGGSLLIRREVWDLVGGMSEDYYPAYYEDIDFCLSAAEAGWETWYQPASIVIHERSASTNPILRSFLMEKSKEQFKRRWQTLLTTFESHGPIEQAVWRAMGSPVRVLIIDDRIPDPSIGTGYGRMRDTIANLAREPDIYVSFHPHVLAVDDRFTVSGVRIIIDLEQHLRAEGVHYDVVIVSRPHNVELYRETIDQHLPRAVKIYDAEALFFRRLEMQATRTPDGARGQIEAEAVAAKELEVSILRWANLVVCISQIEAEVVAQITASPVRVVSPRLDLTQPTEAPFHERSGLGFIAGWSSGPGAPNSDGLLWFAREVLPMVRALHPETRLRITGFNPPSDVRWLDSEQIEFVGEVGNLRSFYDEIRVAISPTRFGAGVKIKSVEAIQFAVPLVCTSEAASGLPSALRDAVWVADGADEFANAVAELLSNEQAWSHMRDRCLAAEDRTSTEGTDTEMWAWPDIVRDAATAQARSA